MARASGVFRNDLWLPDTSFEVVVADDGSEDATAAIVGIVADDVGVRLVDIEAEVTHTYGDDALRAAFASASPSTPSAPSTSRTSWRTRSRHQP